MVSSSQWAAAFTVNSEDIDYLINLLLEREIPMSSRELALALIQNKLETEAFELQGMYEGAQIYNPSHPYEVGQRVIFPALKYATATVEEVRDGNNEQYGDFKVIGVTIEGENTRREFAAALSMLHKLSVENDEAPPLPGANEFSADDVLAANEEDIISELEQQLVEARTLAYVGKKWFPKDLLLEVNEGHLHLADAVLDMMGDIPQTTDQILEGLGGISDAPVPLQIFSMNYALKDDERFDEVGPAGQVLWFLTRQEPQEVRQTPQPLRYSPVDYDPGMLTPEMQALEAELADELSTHLKSSGHRSEATFVLTYPHRRAATIPLNIHTRQIFPTARRAARVYVKMIDGQDGEEYVGWVVNRENYVFGAGKFFSKHKVPIGGYVTVRKSDDPGRIIIDIPAHRPRSEYIRLIVPSGDSISFEDHKRFIGSDFDDLMIIGIDDLQGLDTVIQQQQRRSLAAIMKILIPALGKLTPQGTAHVRTIYSAVNVLRRCPPGPIMASLNTNPDFENVGGHYWRLSGS